MAKDLPIPTGRPNEEGETEGVTKCTLNLLCSESLSLSSIHRVPHDTGTAQSFIYFFKEGRLVCHHFGMCFEKPPGTLHLSWRRRWRQLTAASSIETHFFIFFFLLIFKPELVLTTANTNSGQ